MKYSENLFAIIILLSSVWSVHSYAGISIGATRIIYNAEKNEASVSVSNYEKGSPYLIQSWVEVDEGNSKAPFIITPPLFRLDGGQQNVLRIVHAKGDVPMDRESIYWLNIKAIPSTEKSDKNHLLITIKNRLKLFYRPENLMGEPGDAYKKISFKKVGGKLHATNNSVYHVSFNELRVGDFEIKDPGMLSPMSSASWDVSQNSGNIVSWKAINDFGGITPLEKQSL